MADPGAHHSQSRAGVCHQGKGLDRPGWQDVYKRQIVHIPVIIGSLLLGPKKGAILGALFGLTSFLNNSFVSPNATSFVFTPLYSVGDFQGNAWSLVICFLPRILVGVVPVSYTHLDVYKRQRSAHPADRAAGLYGAAGKILTGGKAPPGKGGGHGGGYIPVSYTHLDVYKRQAPRRPVWLGRYVEC